MPGRSESKVGATPLRVQICATLGRPDGKGPQETTCFNCTSATRARCRRQPRKSTRRASVKQWRDAKDQARAKMNCTPSETTAESAPSRTRQSVDARSVDAVQAPRIDGARRVSRTASAREAFARFWAQGPSTRSAPTSPSAAVDANPETTSVARAHVRFAMPCTSASPNDEVVMAGIGCIGGSWV